MFGWVPENAQEIIFKCLFLSKMKKNKIQNFSSEPSTQTQGPQKIYIYTKTKYLDDQYKKI